MRFLIVLRNRNLSRLSLSLISDESQDSQVRRKSTRTAAAAAVLPLYAISLVYLKMNGGREVKMALPARRWDLNYKSDSIIPGLESCHHIRSSDDHMFNLHFNPYLAFVWYDHYQLPFPGCLFQLFFIHPPIKEQNYLSILKMYVRIMY